MKCLPSARPLIRLSASSWPSALPRVISLKWRLARECDVKVVSGKHGIVGMVDRITQDGAFSIIRASGAMPFGTYATDRLRIAAIAFCLEEMTGNNMEGGHVEYIPDGISRFHMVTAPGPAAGDRHPAQDPVHPRWRDARAPAQTPLQPVQI